MHSERVTAKRAALRLRIIKVALEAFAARGFEATTTVAIADSLHMTGPALYHYFQTKEELLFACMDHILQELHSTLSTIASGSGHPGARIADVVRAQLKVELKIGGVAQLINAHLYGPSYLIEVLSPVRRNALRLRQRALVEIFRELIAEGVQAQEFDVSDVRVAAFNVLALIQYTSVWYRPRRGRPLSVVLDAQVAEVLKLLGVA